MCISGHFEQSHRERGRTTVELLERDLEKGNVDSGLQVQLEEDGDGSTRQSGWK